MIVVKGNFPIGVRTDGLFTIIFIMIRVILFFTLLLAIGCQDENQEQINFNEVVQLRDSDFNLEDLSESISNYWECAVSQYSIEEICGCDCSSINLIQEIQIDCGSYLHKDFKEFHNDIWNSDFECDELRNKLRPSCSYDSPEEFERAILDAFVLIPQINIHEADFIKLIFESGISNFDIYRLREEWYNLPTNEINQNVYSAIVLEVTNSYFEHIEGVEDEDVILAAPWKAATIAGGAAWGFVSAFVSDVIQHVECGSCSDLSWEEVAISTGLGALGGAAY